MPQQYRVSQGCAVIVGGTKYRAGDVLPADYAPKKTIDDHVRSRHVTPVGSQDQKRIEESTTPPGVEPAIPTKSNSGDDNEPGDGVVTQINAKGVQEVSQRRTTDAKVENSPWNINPDELQGKSVDELNVMILERAPEGGDEPPEFETPEEAVAYLSQDHAPEQ